MINLEKGEENKMSLYSSWIADGWLLQFSAQILGPKNWKVMISLDQRLRLREKVRQFNLRKRECTLSSFLIEVSTSMIMVAVSCGPQVIVK